MWPCLQTFLVVGTSEDTNWWVEARDAADHSIMQRMVPTTKPKVLIVLKFRNSTLNEEQKTRALGQVTPLIGTIWGK